MPDYKFSIHPLDESPWIEIRFVLPSPNATPLDLTGPEARKRIAKWVLSSTQGLAAPCGVNLNDLLYQIYTLCAQAIDQEHAESLIIQAVQRRTCAPQDLEENPPEGLEAEQTRALVQGLLAKGVLALDDDQKLVTQMH